MTLDDIFMTITNGLLYITSFSRNQTVEPIQPSPPTPYHSTLQLTCYGLNPAKTSFTYRWAVESLSELMQVNMVAGRHSGFHFNVFLIGVPIGKGSFAMGTS